MDARVVADQRDAIQLLGKAAEALEQIVVARPVELVLDPFL